MIGSPGLRDVYFTWPDRVLSYECRGCGACCKGLGIGLDATAGEVERLATAYPPLVTFLRRRGDTVTAFNPRDRCWFLDDGGLCRVETDLGRAAKPASCRLFPFNRVFQLGDTTVVDYNSVICPLRAGAAGAGVAHDDIVAEIDGIRDAAIVGTALPLDDPGLLARERAIADACFAAARTGDLAIACEAQEVGASLDGFDAIAGVAWTAPLGETLAAALWLTPSLRFNELYGPRQYAPRKAMAALLPRMWLAWLGFAALGAELARRPLGLQELTTIWSEQAPLGYALARWNAVPTLQPGAIELPGNDPGHTVRALAQAFIDNRRAKKPLGELATPLLAARPALERATLVKLAEPVLRKAFASVR